MKNLIKHVQNVNALHSLWSRGDVVVIGVSGGPDSMCLLDVMAHIAQKEDLTVVMAHVNYGLRGSASKKDQELVEKKAQEYGLLCEIYTYGGDVVQNENAWRRVRYDFFEDVREKHVASVIAVAHNKDDQAETLLLHLLRGSGLRGLSGMRYRSEGGVIRPLLSVSREEIIDYCKKNSIAFRIDASNESDEHLRNKVRNNLMPYLAEQYNENIIETLSKTATIIADDYAAMSECVERFWDFDSKLCRVQFAAERLCDLSPAAQRTAIRAMIEQLRGDITDIEMGFVEEIRKAVRSEKSKNQIVKGKDLKMLKKGGTVELACC